MAQRRPSTTPLDDLFAHSDAINARTRENEAGEQESREGETAPDAQDQEDQDEDAAPEQETGERTSRSGAGGEGAGAFLALIAYPLLVNLLDGGPAQMWGWVKAKFINQPYGGSSSSGPSSKTANPTNAQTTPLGREKV